MKGLNLESPFDLNLRPAAIAKSHW